MKLKKTYQDFVKEVITEAKVGVLKDDPNSFGNTFVKDIANAINNYRQEREKMIREMRTILPIYAQSFLRIHNNPATYTRFFDDLLIHYPHPNIYQTIVHFFRYYIQNIMHGNYREVSNTLQQAAQTIEMDRKYYSRRTIRFVVNFIRHSDRYRDTFIRTMRTLNRRGVI